jgi:hypothetical protein
MKQNLTVAHMWGVTSVNDDRSEVTPRPLYHSDIANSRTLENGVVIAIGL